MDHLDAEKIKAAERYMLGDLSVPEVEEFERHFFDCPQCSEELRALTVFQENARAVFVEQDLAPIPASVHAPESAASWWRGLSPLSFMRAAMVMAALVIGIFAGYMAFASHEGAQAIGEYPLYAQARGEETIVSPAAGSKFYTLYFDKTWEGNSASYRASVRDASSVEKLSVPVTLDAQGDAIHVLVPTHQLPGGKYVLVMLGSADGKETELARFPYTLQIK
jgi:anti-sigma factor RsiW